MTSFQTEDKTRTKPAIQVKRNRLAVPKQNPSKTPNLSAQEDFDPMRNKETTEEPAATKFTFKPEPEVETISTLDLFALMTLPGLCQRLQDFNEVAKTAYHIGQQMLEEQKKHR